MHTTPAVHLCIFGMLPLGLCGQTYLMTMLDVYHRNDTKQCNARSWFSRRTNTSDTDIIVQRFVNDSMKLELARCPIGSDTWTMFACKANFFVHNCKERVKFSCSVESNQTKVDIETEIKIAELHFTKMCTYKTIAVHLCVYGLLPLGLYGQDYLITFKSPMLDVYHPNDTLECNVRFWFSRRTNMSDTSIIVRQFVNDSMELELARCPIGSDAWTSYACNANFLVHNCKERVNFSCAVESNQTKVDIETEIKIAGNPAHLKSFRTRYHGIDNDSANQTFPSMVLIELICEGEVPMTANGKVFQNINFCRKSQHRFTILNLQNQPTFKTYEISNNGCVANQKATAFMHLSGAPSDIEVVCETGYRSTFPNCGSGKYQKSIRIHTQLDITMIEGPFVVNRDVQGDMTLVSVSCKITTDLPTIATVKGIRWCIRKAHQLEFKQLSLQEHPDEVIFNTTFGTNLESVAVFHISQNNKNIQIICEANYSEKCGSGTLRKGIFLNTEKSNDNNHHVMLLVGIGMFVVGTFSMVAATITIILHRRKATSAFMNCDEQTTSTALENLEGQGKQQDEFYENRLVKSVRVSKPAYALNDTHTGAASEIYEATAENTQDQHIYEERRNSGEIYEDI